MARPLSARSLTGSGYQCDEGTRLMVRDAEVVHFWRRQFDCEVHVVMELTEIPHVSRR